MAIQTSYNQELTRLIAGMKQGTGPHETVSRVAATGIEFGSAALRAPGAADELVKVPTNITDEFIGVVCFSHAVNTDAVLGADENVEAEQPLAIERRGRIAVRIDENVDQDAEVHIVGLSAGGDTPGHFRATQDGVNTFEVTAGARWAGVFLAADGLAVLELNLPQ